MHDLVPLEKPEVFVPETPSRMMSFLVAHVINDRLELRVTVGKSLVLLRNQVGTALHGKDSLNANLLEKHTVCCFASSLFESIRVD